MIFPSKEEKTWRIFLATYSILYSRVKPDENENHHEPR